MTHLAFFVTGHGFGHGVRTSALINALPADVQVSLFTALPEAFFREELHRPFRRFECEIDLGCIQSDTLSVDIPATLKTYAAINADREKLIALWSRALREIKADALIGDIPPLAFPIAQAAGIPGYAIGNFAWTDIYAPYVETMPGYGPLLEQMRRDYACASFHLRLEPYHGLDFPAASHSVGMLARLGKPRREALASRFGLDLNAHWALVYIGSHGLPGLSWRGLSAFPNWQFLGLYDLPGAGPHYRRVEKTPDFGYADLTASCQAIVGKLGYGLVTEAFAHATPVIFPARSDFSEFEMLKKAIESRRLGREIPLKALQNMELGPYLDWALTVKVPPMPSLALPKILERLGFSPYLSP